MLDRVNLFSGLSLGEIEQIEGIARRASFNRGETIFQQDDFSREFYIIESGQVEISVRDVLQNRRVVTVLKNGDFFGEMALFDKTANRSATARTLQATVLLVIPGVEFESLLQRKPAISFKLLGAMSKRLKETTNRSLLQGKSTESPTLKEATVITVIAPRDGYGKTTFATSLACLLAAEVPRRVLFVDLDLRFAEATYHFGVYSPRSICGFASVLKKPNLGWEDLNRFFQKVSEHLYILPGPNNFLEGEGIRGHEVAEIVKACRPHFDYLIIDTGNQVDEVFLNTLDVADRIFALADLHDMLALKSDVRYFQGLGKLNFPEDRMKILVNRLEENGNLEKMRKLFSFNIVGALPKIAGAATKYGQTAYQDPSFAPLTSVIRVLAREHLKEATLKESPNKGFFFRLFFDGTPTATVGQDGPLNPLHGLSANLPSIPEDTLTVILKFIRTNVLYGNYEEARQQALKLLYFTQRSSLLYQLLGEILTLEKNYSEAIEVLRKAIDIDPQNYMAMSFLAFITGDEPLFGQALGLIQARLQANPSYPDLLNDHGKLLYQMNKPAEARVQFQAALEKNPRYLEARLNLALAFGENGDLDQAINTLLEIEPRNIRVYYLLGKYFYATGSFAYALEAFSKASEIRPDYYDTGEKIDELQDYFNRINTLIQMHQDILRTQKKYPDLHVKLGNLFALVGKRDEAERELREAIRLNPNYQVAQDALEALRRAPQFQVTLKLPDVESDQKGTETGFRVDLQFSKLSGNADSALIMGPSLVRIKNLRTGKTFERVLPPECFSGENHLLDCPALGQLSVGDILMAQITDQISNTTLRALPHTLSEFEVSQGTVHLGISPVFDSVVSDSVFGAPVRYFLVNVKSQMLSESLKGTEFQATMVNLASGYSCKGAVSPESPDEIHFVFMAPDGKNVVKEGDQLRMKILDQKGLPSLNMDFQVTSEDVETFVKIVAIDLPDSLKLPEDWLDLQIPDPGRPFVQAS